MTGACNREWYIYVLKNPSDGEVRYVGWAFDVARRFAHHLVGAKLGKTHSARWINRLLSEGSRPQWAIVETGSGDWAAAERKWIAELRRQGCRLTNHTDGGEGTPGRRDSPATREKRAAAMRGRKMPREGVERQAAKMRGRKIPRHSVEKQAAKIRGRRQTAAHIAKRTATMKGRLFSAETRAKLSAAQHIRFARHPVPEGLAISQKTADAHARIAAVPASAGIP